MTIPKLTISVVDPGRGAVVVNPGGPVVLGGIVGGSDSEGLVQFNDLDDVRSRAGFGTYAEDIAKILAEAGGPVYGAGLSSLSVAGANSAVVEVGTGNPDITLSGTGRETYTGEIVITKAGARGVARFKYTLDAHDPDVFEPTYSPEYVVPSGGTFLAGDSGLTFNFAAGSYATTHSYTFTCRPARMNATDIGDAAGLIHASQSEPALWHCSGTALTAAEGATLFGTLSTQLALFASGNRFARGLIDLGSFEPGTEDDSSTSSVDETATPEANILEASAALSDRRVCPGYGFHYVSSALPYEGFSVRKVSSVSSVSARASRVLVSTDLARYAEGSLGGVLGIDYDSTDSDLVDAAGISTLRTWRGAPGFYITNARLKSPPGSDFTYLHFGRLMDLACSTLRNTMLQFSSEGFRTISGGTLHPLDAADIESAGNEALANALLRPSNARGTGGHVSAVSVTVDLAHNIVSTDQLKVKMRMRPLGYAKEIIITAGFTVA